MAGGRVTFANARARFQRLSDAKLFNGWVSALTGKNVIVAAEEGAKVQLGQTFRFQVFGSGATAVFDARLETISDRLLAFALSTPIRAVPSSEDMRMRTRNLSALLLDITEGEPANGDDDMAVAMTEARVVDVSGKGLGLHISRAYKKGAKVKVVIDTPWGQTECTGEVRYSKPEAQGFRVGLLIVEIDRLNQGRFARLLQTTAA